MVDLADRKDCWTFWLLLKNAANRDGIIGAKMAQKYHNHMIQLKQLLPMSTMADGTVKVDWSSRADYLMQHFRIKAHSRSTVAAVLNPVRTAASTRARRHWKCAITAVYFVSILSHSPAVLQRDKDHCFACKRYNVVQCACQFYFCEKHQARESHECTFDVKKRHQERLRRQNPKVRDRRNINLERI